MVLFMVSLVLLVCAIKGGDHLQHAEVGKFSIDCIDIKMCKPVQDFLDYEKNKKFDKTTKDLLKSYQCTEGKPIKIWCTQQTLSEMRALVMQPPNVDKHKNVNLLPSSCGNVRIAEKIFNGNKTGILQYPWMALLSYKSNAGPVFKCGGTIINEQYILTAAHCIKKKPLFVRIGDHNINTPIDCETNDGEKYCTPAYQDLTILKFIPHQNYSKSSSSNDIALLMVSKIDVSIENTKPICLPFGKVRNFNFLKKPSATITGWGLTKDRMFSPHLQQAFVSIVEVKPCREKFNASISYREFCAVGTSSVACMGDSGGPIQSIVIFEDNSKYFQHGILSRGGTHCNNPELPNVYTQVAFYMEWILDNITP